MVMTEFQEVIHLNKPLVTKLKCECPRKCVGNDNPEPDAPSHSWDHTKPLGPEPKLRPLFQEREKRLLIDSDYIFYCQCDRDTN